MCCNLEPAVERRSSPIPVAVEQYSTDQSFTHKVSCCSRWHGPRWSSRVWPGLHSTHGFTLGFAIVLCHPSLRAHRSSVPQLPFKGSGDSSCSRAKGSRTSALSRLWLDGPGDPCDECYCHKEPAGAQRSQNAVCRFGPVYSRAVEVAASAALSGHQACGQTSRPASVMLPMISRERVPDQYSKGCSWRAMTLRQ